MVKRPVQTSLNRSFTGPQIPRLWRTEDRSPVFGLLRSWEFAVLIGLGPVQSRFFSGYKTGLPNTNHHATLHIENKNTPLSFVLNVSTTTTPTLFITPPSHCSPALSLSTLAQKTQHYCHVFCGAWLPPMGMFFVLLTFPSPAEHPKHTIQAYFACLASSTPLVLLSTRKMRRLCCAFHAGWLPSTASHLILHLRPSPHIPPPFPFPFL